MRELWKHRAVTDLSQATQRSHRALGTRRIHRCGWPLVLVILILPVFAQDVEVVETFEDIAWQQALAQLDTLESYAEAEDTATRLDRWLDDLRASEDSTPQLLLQALDHAYQTIYDERDYRGALPYLEEYLATHRTNHGIDHPQTLAAMGALGEVYLRIGRFSEAEEVLSEALARLQRTQGETAKDALFAAANLAVTLSRFGNLQEAKTIQKAILENRLEAVGPEHPHVLGSRNNLAMILLEMGDFEGARVHQEEVYSVSHRVLGPLDPTTLRASANLGRVYRAIGNLDGARQLAEEAYASRIQLLGETHHDTLLSGAYFAAALKAIGDVAGARQLYEVVLDTSSQVLGEQHPDSLRIRIELAAVLRELGDLPQAKRQAEQVIAWSRKVLGPSNPDTLRAQADLAATLRAMGQLDDAALHLQDIFDVRRRTSDPDHRPNTEAEAEELFEMGRAQVGLGSPAEALSHFLDGLGALEAQTLRTDPSETIKSRYIARYGTVYKEVVATGLSAKNPDAAFHTLERYRTQGLLSLLRWSHSEAAQAIPRDLRTELHQIARRYDWLTREQDRIYPQRNPEWVAEQEQLRRRREVIQGQVVAARRAKGDLPLPLAVDDVQQLLDSGSLLLSFAIGEETSHLFALTQQGYMTVPIDVTNEGLKIQIDRFRTLIDKNEDTEARQALSQWLYQRLLAPVALQIQAAQRVLILPDGPLNFLSFAALTRPVFDDPRGWQYLAEWKPMHSVQSATVYGELLAQREDGAAEERPWQWAGLGAPIYPAMDDGDSSTLPDAVRSTTERGIWDGLTPLPHTEREIQGIAQLFPEDRIQPLLHRDANEDRARQVLGQASIVHFAAHGLADPDYPMDSFLALSLDDGATSEHNGLLQAWEIANQLRLDADLVVLSACVTALGPNRGGEGLISLSRAFQIAGARSVLASLWSVNDLSTSELMLRFYRHLRDGEPKDRALQLAQQELIRGPVEVTLEDGTVVERDFSSPYHWAAFQLIGDWQ